MSFATHRTLIPVLVVFIIFATAGCASPGADQTTQQPAPESESVEASAGDQWLYEPFYEAFPKFGDVVEDELQVLRANLDGDPELEVFAWLNLDRGNALAVLLDLQGDTPEPVYVIRQPVYYTAFDEYTRSLVIAAGSGGTGFQVNWFRVIREVDGQFRNVWTGISHSMMMTPTGDSLIDGQVLISGEDDNLVLRHMTVHSHTDSSGKTYEHQSIRTFNFDEMQGSFVPRVSESGPGNRIILDRYEAYPGEVIAAVIVGCSTEKATLSLTREGETLWTREVEPSAEQGGEVSETQYIPAVPFMPLEGLAPGEYRVELHAQTDSGEDVSDYAVVRARAKDE